MIHVALFPLLCHAKPDGLCIPSERDSLLSLKQDLSDPSNRLSSWEEDSLTDCCHWSGVVCHNTTGHVLQLRLGCIPSSPTQSTCWGDDEKTALGGKLNPALLNLKHLTHLDLSLNDFQGVPIPTFLGSMENLRYLNLSAGGFGGTIPHRLGNLSKLQSLDLGFLDSLTSSSLGWAAGLSSLQFLRLSWVDLSRAGDWLQVTSQLPFLQQLRLSFCELVDIPTSLPAINFSSLSVLYLSHNSLSLVPAWIITLPALATLSLSYNNLQGPIPVALGNLTGLTVLNLSGNRFNSSIPKSLFNLNKLEELDLRSNSLQGRIPAGITNMTSLTNLDLSFNQLTSSLPESLFDLNKLEELHIRGNCLQGKIPGSIGNMTSLTSLDLSYNLELQGGDSFKWLGNLCKLTRIYFSGIKFGGNVKSLSGCILHGLVELYLGEAQLSGQFSDLVDHLAQFKNLALLYLSDNSLHGPIPESIRRLSSLKSLYLSDNQLAGPIPDSIERLSSLEKLDLSDNQLVGSIPDSIGTLASLQELLLRHNQLNGTFPESLGQLKNLEWLDTSYNLMIGDVCEVHFANLTNLRHLEASENTFSLKVSPKWVPPFQLRELYLDSWLIGPQFPTWLLTQTNLIHLQMPRVAISSTIPNWFWNSFPHLSYLDLSQNQIHGNFNESSIILPSADIIDISSNQFTGLLPLISPNLAFLKFSNNYFSGSISPFLCHKPHELKKLEYLNVQSNHLLGELPDCWRTWSSLTIMRFGNNEFSGNIPNSMGNLQKLQSLHFENNHLQGEIPTSLGNCKLLKSLNLGENNFTGSIPFWIGKQFALLKLLRLHSNKFGGKIPDQICALTSLQILDFSHNNLYGSIPICFKNFTDMTTIQKNASIPIYVSSQGDLEEDALLVWKGIAFEYNKILGLMTSIDLSSNKLSKEIPEELTSLVGMRSLNLSNNLLTDTIPKMIGDMHFLDSIDFSHNQISGPIPLSMSTLTFLSYLDLSDNNLVGRIPLSTQLQSFNPSTYAGNELCGPPLTNNCSIMLKVKSEQGKEEEEVEVYIIYGSLTIGFIVGFWIVWGPLLFMKSWRLAYLKSLESLCQKIYGIGSARS